MNKKILIIEDEKEILEALKIILESRGFIVNALSSYLNSTVIAKFMPNLILLDLLVAGQSGENIARSIQKNNKLKEIPIIIISAQPIHLLKKSAEACRAANFLQKPFSLSDLIKVISKTI